jgi:hypothetical protein
MGSTGMSSTGTRGSAEPDDGREPGPPRDAPHGAGSELLGVLGVGAGGPVWRARSVTDAAPARGQDVAVKVVRGGDDVQRELALLRRVRHEHVVGLRDSVPLADGAVALVLDLVDGGTLAQLVAARRHLTPGEVVTVLAPLATALADLHALGIQHGDVAPGNVLLDREGRPFLSDLGTVRITGELREEQFGTPGYLDPVVLAGGAGGPSSDVYGLGALAWFSLTGCTPPSALVREPLVDALPGLPAELGDVVEAALDPDPARRPGPAELARRMYDAVPPQPVWQVGSAPADGGLTHRIRRLAAAESAEPRHRARGGRKAVECLRHSGVGQVVATLRAAVPRWAAAILVALVVALTVGALVVAVPLGRHPAGEPRTQPSRGSGHLTPAEHPSQRPAALDVARTTATVRPADVHPRGVRTAAVPSRLSDRQAVAVVQTLSSARAATFEGADESALDAVTVPGSPADRAARAAIVAMRAAGVRYRGVHLRVRTAQVSGVGPQGTSVEVVTDVSAYDVVGRDGDVRRHLAARPGTASRLVLVLTAAGWRVAAVDG